MNINFDRRSKTSLAQQLEIALRLKIVHGELSLGESLPSEDALACELDMQPAEVLKAYQALAKGTHLVYKNKTWIVNYGKISNLGFEQFTPLFDIIQCLGLITSIKTLILKKDDIVPKELNSLIPFSRTLYTRRLYYGNDIPLVLMDSYFPQELFSGFETILAANQPYYDKFKSVFNLEFSRSERTVEASNLRKNEAEILEVPIGSAYCYSIVKTYDKLSRLIEVNQCWILPDTMHFTLEQDE